MNECQKTETRAPLYVPIGQLVAGDYRIAEVCQKLGIDFIRNGKDTLLLICERKGLNPADVLREIQTIQEAPSEKVEDFRAWEVSPLIDYIVETHHAYLYENIEKVSSYVHEIANLHGLYHPELIKVAEVFDKIVGDLVSHLPKEEKEIFPLFKQIEKTRKSGGVPDLKNSEKIRKFLNELIREHEEVEAELLSIRRPSRVFNIFGVVCSTHAVNFEQLKEFEADLQKHVHLENNILIPKIEQLLR